MACYPFFFSLFFSKIMVVNGLQIKCSATFDKTLMTYLCSVRKKIYILSTEFINVQLVVNKIKYFDLERVSMKSGYINISCSGISRIIIYVSHYFSYV